MDLYNILNDLCDELRWRLKFKNSVQSSTYLSHKDEHQFAATQTIGSVPR